MCKISIEEVREIFNEHQETLTIYIVSFEFFKDNGFDYFKQYIGKENFISSDINLNKHLGNIIKWLAKNCPNLSELVYHLLHRKSNAAIQDIVTIMSQTFTTYNHQAVGPHVIDPIIIQEGAVDEKKIIRMISVYEYSIVQPTIIIILKDNNFERVGKLLSKCPNGIYVKYVKNDMQHEMNRIINVGSENIDEFIDAYTTQCFSTCSHTPRNIILNEALRQNPLIENYTPAMFKIRSQFLYDHKNEEKESLDIIIKDIKESKENNILKNSFLCLALLNRVFCMDKGGQDILDALSLAQELNNDVLLAHVYRYADLIPNINREEQKQLLSEAKKIFRDNGMYDHALYSENNELVLELYEDKIDAKKYKDLAIKATSEVHGLVGTSHIQNNAGVAYLLSGNPERAIEFFENGLAFAQREDRIVQRAAIQVNLLLAKSYALEPIDPSLLVLTMQRIFDSLGTTELPYLTSNYVMNILSLSLKHSSSLYNELINNFPVIKLLNTALKSNDMCSGQLILQMKVLAKKYPEFTLLGKIFIPNKLTNVSGKRKQFIEKYNMNPFVFNVWI